jgi:hypothetical protein
MAAVMIGVDPHKGSHTAVAIGAAEEPLGQVRVRACATQAERLLAWAKAWPQRTWAVEGAGGLGQAGACPYFLPEGPQRSPALKPGPQGRRRSQCRVVKGRARLSRMCWLAAC